MGSDRIQLFDLVPSGQMQEVQDAFAAATGISAVLIDPDGFPLTRTSNPYEFCERMQNDPKGLEKCIITNTSLIQKNLETHDVARMACPHSGLATASVPVMLDGEMLCVWIIGQVRLEDPPDSLMEKTAADLAMDAGELKKCMRSLPMITREEFGRILEFLKVLTNNLIQTGKVNLDLQRSNDSLRHTSGVLGFTAKMLRRFIDSSGAGMYISDFYTGEIFLGNQEYLKHSGLTEEEALGRKCWEVGGYGGNTFCAHCPRDKLLDSEGKPVGSYSWENYNERWHCWLRFTNQAILWADGRLAHMVTYWDVTQEHIMRDQLSKIAFYDRQMGLPNVEKLLADLGEGGLIVHNPRLFIVAFDTTMLRKLNDVYGRFTVDELLHMIITWVRAQNYPNSTIYRIFGDQFCLLLNNTEEEGARGVADDIYNRFKDTWAVQIGNTEMALACQASISVICAEGKPADDELLTLIERTLDISKKRNCVVVHDKQMVREAEEHARLEMSLKRCVNAGMKGFGVFFQPIVDPAAGVWRGLEALCRWDSPELGPIPPLTFIREAEQMGLIDIIGAWVLRQAIAHCKAWKLDELEIFFLAVNLSPLQVLNERLTLEVSEMLREFDYPGEKLSLEVTESEALFFSQPTLEAVENLRFRGIKIALDDFGSGYSSFKNLKNLPASFLKTEREFINGIEKDSYMQYFFSIMAELAHATDMKLIAEGVENREQLEVVLKNGADYVQGYYFSHPLSPEKVEKKLEYFCKVNAAFYVMGTEAWEPAFPYSGKDSCVITPKLYRVLNQCMRILLSDADTDSAVNDVLRIVGQSMRVNRAYLLQERAGGLYGNTHEWCAEGVSPQKGLLKDFILDEASLNWRRLLEREGMIVASNVAKLPADIRRVLKPQNILAIMVLPVWEGNIMMGSVGFDSDHFREWLPEEVTMLRNLSVMMGNSLKREKMQQEIDLRGAAFVDVLNHMDVPVFVSDLETDEILWANDELKHITDRSEIEGAMCHEVFYRNSKRCDFCKIGILEKNAAVRQCNWEYFNNRLGRYYMIYDSIVNWMDGKKVHLGYGLDISEIKRVQKRLNHYSLTDSFTGPLSNRRLEERLQIMLAEAQQTGAPLAVVSLDIVRLRKANETYGYSFGDMLIANVVGEIFKVAREYDVIGRTGGDTFSLLMPACTAREAAEIVDQAKARLDAQKLTDTEDRYSFAFGVAESTELPYSMGMEHVTDLLNLAAKRMRGAVKADR